MVFSLASDSGPLFDQADPASSFLVTVTHLIDQLTDQVDAEAALPAAVKNRRRHRGGVERRALVVQSDADLLRVGLQDQLDRLIGLSPVGVPDNVGRCLLHGQLQLMQGLGIGDRAPDVPADLQDQAAHLAQMLQIAGIPLSHLHHVGSPVMKVALS